MVISGNQIEISESTLSAYRQYTFMQIQKEIEYSSEFSDFKECEFHFKALDEELRDHETYNGIDNYIKYFIKVQMTYEGGSLLAGSTLEKLHEIVVKNHYALNAEKQRLEEIKQQERSTDIEIDTTVVLDQTVDLSPGKHVEQPIAYEEPVQYESHEGYDHY